MRDSTELPELKMLPVEKLIPHEHCDPRRTKRLSRRIMDEGLFKHPPVIASIPETDTYVVLDGANRTTAMRELGMPHIVAQVVEYKEPHVMLDSWYHVVSGISFEALIKQLRDIHTIEWNIAELAGARKAISEQSTAGYMIAGESVYLAKLLPGRDIPKVRIINHIVDAYLNKADIFRASNDIWDIQKPYYPQMTALFVFPQLSPDDVVEAARNGPKIPTGITRHIISPRALHLNIPLWVLAADWSLDRKVDWLRDWLMERMAANAIRYYSESTFTYNEY